LSPASARGHQNQDAASGPTKIEGGPAVRGLNALAAAICTALGTPLIAATRLRGGNANAARDPVSFAAEVAAAARAADAPRWSSCWRTRVFWIVDNGSSHASGSTTTSRIRERSMTGPPLTTQWPAGSVALGEDIARERAPNLARILVGHSSAGRMFSLSRKRSSGSY
jgi:hypothetical protein